MQSILTAYYESWTSKSTEYRVDLSLLGMSRRGWWGIREVVMQAYFFCVMKKLNNKTKGKKKDKQHVKDDVGTEPMPSVCLPVPDRDEVDRY